MGKTQKSPPSTSVSGIDHVAKKGEYILATLEKRLDKFSSIAQKVGQIRKKVDNLLNEVCNLKNKRAATEIENDKTKRPRTENEPEEETTTTTTCSNVNNTSSDIEDYLNGTESCDSEDEEDDLYSELDNFFTTEEEIGEDIEEKLAHVSNKALKNKPNEDNLKDLKKKHKRPGKVEYLQVQKVDHVIWQQLRAPTKATDFQLQRSHSALAAVAVPIIKAVGCLQKSDHQLRSHLTDAFKLVISLISNIKSTRREKIKRDLDNKYKSLAECEESAEKFFGDNIPEKIKALGDPKVTLVHTGKKHFLDQRPRQIQGRQQRHPFPWGQAAPHQRGYRTLGKRPLPQNQNYKSRPKLQKQK